MSTFGTLTSYLPPAGDDLLPKWLFLVAVFSGINSVQAYSSLLFTKKIYNRPSKTTSQTTTIGDKKQSTTSQVNELSARTFGSWTALSFVVRFYATFNLHEPLMYQLAMWTFVIAFIHFVSEIVLFRSAKPGFGLIWSPMVVSTVSIVWMWLRWDKFGVIAERKYWA